MAARRFPWVLTVFSGIVFAILIGLGVWQIERLKWKTELLAEVAAARTAPARPLAEVLASPNPNWRRVSLDCPGLASAPYIELHSIVEGEVGRRLISACPLAGGGSILVDRGFVDAEISARPAVAAATAPVPVIGVLRAQETPGRMTLPPTDGVWYARDLGTMATALKTTNAVPYFIAAESVTTPGFGALKPVPLPTDIPNRHLGYVITWFGLAGALAYVYAALLFRRRKTED